MFVLEIILTIIFCIGIFFWWWQRSARFYWKKYGVSYIPGPPLIGALKDAVLFRKSFAEVFSDFHTHNEFKDEPISGVYFFHKPSLIIRHPEIIKNILLKDFPNFMNRTLNSDPENDVIGVDNLYAVRGERWRIIRRKISPIFTTGKLKKFFSLLEDVTKMLDQKFSLEIGDEPREYEMKDLSLRFTADTVAICAFGLQTKCLLNQKVEFFRKAKKIIEFTWRRAIEVAVCFFIPELAIPLRFTMFSKEASDFLRSTINHVIDERLKSDTPRDDLIDILIDMKREDGDLFRGDTLVAQAAIFLTAGFETPSTAISFALYELAHHPEIQEKVRKEIMEYIEKYGDIQYETISEMNYLTCIVQETLRLYPDLPFIDRICSPENGGKSYTLEPYHKFAIPRGMNVYISTFSLHRDPKYFPNPLEFIPERFSAENRHSIDQYTYLPFGLGPRNCIGLRLGYLQVKLVLITILRKYRIEATERTPKTIKFNKKTFVLHTEAPLYMNLRRI